MQKKGSNFLKAILGLYLCESTRNLFKFSRTNKKGRYVRLKGQGFFSNSNANIILTARRKSSSHFTTPRIKSRGYKTSSDQYKNAHEDANYNVDKGRKEAWIFASFEKLDESRQLDDGDDKHDDGHEDGKVAVGLGRPIDDELSVFFLPNSRGE